MTKIGGRLMTVVCTVVLAGVLRGAEIEEIPTAGLNDPVVPGQWHSNLAKATQYAKEHNLPLFVHWGDPDCSYCKAFAHMLNTPAFQEYFADSGMVLVHEHSAAGRGTAIKQWVGGGQWPLLRLTWWKNNVKVYDTDASGWQRVNNPKTDATKALNAIKAKYNQLLALGFMAAPPDPSKDQYDPGNDTEAGAVALAWSDQAQTASLRLNQIQADPDYGTYADTNDWFKLPVVAGVTYKVWTTGGAVNLDVVGQSLDGGEFTPVSDSDVFVHISRVSPATAVPSYTLHWQRIAPGTVEFVQTAVTVKENAKNVTLTVRRAGGTTGAAAVAVATEAITATAGQDFVAAPVPATLAWGDGDAATKTVTVTLIKNRADTQWEGAETFAVTLTKTAGDGGVGEAAVVTLTDVDPMRVDAGTYNGFVLGVPGVLTLSISTTGRITGKWTVALGTFTVKNATLVDIANVEVEDGVTNRVAQIAGELTLIRYPPVPFTLGINLETGAASGSADLGEGSTAPVTLFRNNWATTSGKTLLAEKGLAGYYTAAFSVSSVEPETAPQGSGYATVTVDAKGGFRASGKLGDGAAYSQSGTLIAVPDLEEGTTNVFALFFAAPKAYTFGSFFAEAVFGDANSNGVTDVTGNGTWYSLNPQAVAPYTGSGFQAAVTVSGGKYNKAKTLRQAFPGVAAYTVDGVSNPVPVVLSAPLTVKETNALGRVVSTRSTAEWEHIWGPYFWTAPLNAAGTGFVIDRSTLKKQSGSNPDGSPVYNYEAAKNPNGVTMTFTKTTGLLKGAYSVWYDYPTVIDYTKDEAGVQSGWKHTAKKASYTGVVLQENPDEDGALGYGHWLLPGTGVNGTKTYKVNQSGGFTFAAGEAETFESYGLGVWTVVGWTVPDLQVWEPVTVP
jgi:hypothetical protein